MLVFYDVPDHLVDYHLSTIIIIRLIGFITGKVGKCRKKRDMRLMDVGRKGLDEVVSVINNGTVIKSY